MNEIPLHQYVDTHGQTATARQLGVTQGAVWQMVKSKRLIFVVEHPGGEISAYEKKQLGRALQP